MSGLFGLIPGGSAAEPATQAPALSVENMFAQIMGAVQKSVRLPCSSATVVPDQRALSTPNQNLN